MLLRHFWIVCLLFYGLRAAFPTVPLGSPSQTPTTFYPTTAQPTIESTTNPTESPTLYPTYPNLIGLNASSNDLFLIPTVKFTFDEAKEYCNTRYHGLANIYDPSENRLVLQLVNLNFIAHAFIGFVKKESDWKWESGVSSNPFLWLQSPLASITSNIEDPKTGCIYVSRYGWHYTTCNISYYFVCETRDHRPNFTEYGPFALSERKLKFDDARSLCRAQYYDLATIYEEEEYSVAQSLYADNVIDETNCWIGYERGVLNDNEWEWVQSLPITAMPMNQLINTNLWSINPWQISTADVYCQAASNVTILFASDGEYIDSNISGTFEINKLIEFNMNDVLYQSIIRFNVGAKPYTLPGLKCSIHFEHDIYNTDGDDYLYWSVVPSDTYTSYDIVEAYQTVDTFQTSPESIDDAAQWIWNHVYSNKSSVSSFQSVLFEFSFENVKNIQNRDGDDCASISYYYPHKWKTNHCQQKFRFMCNIFDHKATFKVSPNEEFAVLMDRQLTREQSQSLCNNIYGYELATIYSYYEFKQINEMMNGYGIDNAWIGLTYDDDHYRWDTQNEFIFDDWTLDVWNSQLNGDCVKQINESKWQTCDCNSTSYAICNYQQHSPQFTSSQLASFYLLETQLQNYINGEQLCRDYVGVRSTAAIIYHPIENERAIWLCSNSTNNKGCFIGYNNIQYRNETKFRWRNGALIDVFKHPWFGNPWLNISNNTKNASNIDEYLTQRYSGVYNDSDYCTAIVKDENTNEWGWDIVDCDDELNMLCDSGDDHSQCWMLQNCAQCALRRDCGWCGDRCQLSQEICYPIGEELIETEFGCADYDPIVNITYEKDCNYTFAVDIKMCTSTAPQSTNTQDLINYVNFSNCVIQQEVVEFYILTDYEDAKYGNYEILGKVIELKQETGDATTDHKGSNTFENITRFDDHPVCDIRVRHGYVRSITCDKKGAGYGKNATQFDMLHDVLRYLLPRLQKRLFEGYV